MILVAALSAFNARTLWEIKKNQVAPTYKMHAQKLSEEIMAKHPELLSIPFHGAPPGLSKVYAMFAGSFPEGGGRSEMDFFAA